MKKSLCVLTQNSTQGFYEIDDKLGHIVIIEIPHIIAKTGDIDEIAKYIEFRHPIDTGIYFNGVEQGIDCDCCGDRWSVCDLKDIYDLTDDKMYKRIFYNLYDRGKEDIEIRLILNNMSVYQLQVKPYIPSRLAKLREENKEEYNKFMNEKIKQIKKWVLKHIY